jgi:hypothetical protein
VPPSHLRTETDAVPEMSCSLEYRIKTKTPGNPEFCCISYDNNNNDNIPEFIITENCQTYFPFHVTVAYIVC